jgi:hypothetical protein
MKCGGICENVKLQISEYHLKIICFPLKWEFVIEFLGENGYSL